VIVCFVDTGGIVDHHGLKRSFHNDIRRTNKRLYLTIHW